MTTNIICKKCGFTTQSYEDMINHLACVQKYPEEDCIESILELEEEEHDEQK